MRILLATLGSRGDVEPFLALALALQRAGHQPTLCASNRYAEWVKGWGIAHAPMEDGFVHLLESLEGRKGLERAASPLGMARMVWRLAPLAADNYLERRVASPGNVTRRLVVAPAL
jgi:sterol 3beta-glucosyltransferase